MCVSFIHDSGMAVTKRFDVSDFDSLMKLQDMQTVAAERKAILSLDPFVSIYLTNVKGDL